MNVIHFMMFEYIRGERRWNIYVKTFQKFPLLAMGQLSEELHNLVNEWEQQDL